MTEDKRGESLANAMTNSDKKVLGSARLTSSFSQDKKKAIIVTILFWDDGAVTWIGED